MDHAAAKREIEAQEARLTFSSFGLADAWSIATAALERAPGPIAIRIEIGRKVVLAAAADGATPQQQGMAELKLNSVARYLHSSLWLYHDLREQGQTLADRRWLDPLAYAEVGGGFPIAMGGQVVGGIAASGLPHERDHELIVAVLEEHLQRPA